MPKTLSRGNWVETYKPDMAPLDSERRKRVDQAGPEPLCPSAEDDSGENELVLGQDTPG